MKMTNSLLIKTKKPVSIIVTVTAFFSISYAILRYNIFGQIPWKDLPFYVMNKAVSLTAIILYTISPISKFLNKNRTQIPEKRIDTNNTIEGISFSLIIVHVFLSLMLFKPEIFAKFFEKNGTVNLLGGISMITGIISFVLFCGIKLNSLSNIKRNNILYFSKFSLNVIMVFIMAHLFFMGYKGWITPEKWQGGMPPISLIAFVFSSFGLLTRAFTKSDNHILKN